METTTNNGTGVPKPRPLAHTQDPSDGVPAFLAETGIEKGQWQFITKPQLRSLQLPGNLLKDRIWATGMLASIGYKRELAVKQIKKNNVKTIVPLTAGDIARKLYSIDIEEYKRAGVSETELKRHKPHHRQTMCNAIAELEADGKMERRYLGRPFKDMTKKEIQAIPNGKIEMIFWNRPKDQPAENVRKQWESTKDQVKPLSVSLADLPVNAMSLIAKAIYIGDSPESDVWKRLKASEHYNSILLESWKILKPKASEVLVDVAGRYSVSLEGLQSVRPPDSPAVSPTGGALEEREVERELLKGGEGRQAGNSTSDTAPPVQQASRPPAPSPFKNAHEELSQALEARNWVNPPSSIIEKTLLVLKDAPLSGEGGFLMFLDERRGRGTFGIGLLPAIAEDFMQQRKAAVHPIPPTRAKTAIERAKELLRKRLEDDKEKKYA